ncbi:MAG: polysaccharide biosynthesis/export family protein [Deltaproteobacteria bacterium]|nr:polysaccharide biosynthesis/export family protein [Deltaproteobacteria bacterium]
MKKYLATLILLICVLMTLSPIHAADQPPITTTQDYIIGPGDTLNISVWNNEALTRAVTVLPDGKIHFPLIGEVVAGRKTLAVLEKELKTKLHAFVPDPELTVMVGQVNSMLIYVIGKVNHPGRFVLNTNVNVLQALATAGGLNAFAKRNKIKIFREEKGKTHIFPFKYDKVTDGENLEQNVRLERGDVVVVP